MDKNTNYFKRRMIAYTIITLVILITPFIKINGNHFFLLSFDKKILNLFFESFNTNELYLMPFLLIMMFIFIFFITNLLGRVWCAWGCPQTIFRVIYRDLIQTKLFKIYKKRENKQKEPENKPIAKLFSVILFYIIALIASSNFMWYFIPPEDFFVYIKNPSEHKILMGILIFLPLFITFIVTFVKENFCAYICPYARIQSVMLDDDSKTVIYDEDRGGKIDKDDQNRLQKPLGGDCIGCRACVMVCPAHIDIRKGLQLDCINCLECVDECTKVQAKYNRKTLISWSSIKEIKNNEKVKIFRLRTITYIALLLILFGGLLYKASNKETMLLNINRTSELYTLKDDGNRVDNSYTMLFQNTDNKDHIYYLKVLDDKISVAIPTKQFKIKAGDKVKKIVVLTSKLDDKCKNKYIKIKAYAKDDKEIFTIKDTIFIYPKGK